MISTAFSQWAQEPTITTLDTIAAPIDDIQFPTVTVCNDFMKNPPDNWAYLENLLNFVGFDCAKGKDCNETEAVRKDFGFVIRSVTDNFKTWLLKNMKDYGRILNDFSRKKEYEAVVQQIRSMVNNGTLKDEQLETFPEAFFNKDISLLLSNLTIGKKLTFFYEEKGHKSYDSTGSSSKSKS